MKKLILIISFLLQSCLTSAEWQHIGKWTNFTQEKNTFTFQTPPAAVRVTIFSDNIVRVRLAQTRKFSDDFSWAVIANADTTIEISSTETDSSLEIYTSHMRVSVLRNPTRILFYEKMSNQLLNSDDPKKGMGWDGEAVRIWKTMPPDEFYYGFGEKTGSLEKRGSSMVNWNTDFPAYRASTDPLYKSIPFFMAIRKGKTYGIFFDNNYRTYFDVGKESLNTYSFGADGGELNYYFIYGPTPKEVSQNYSKPIGTFPLPPKWSLGYQQSRWSYYPESKVREIAETFRKKKIPCDVIYLDIHYMDGYRVFTWDTTRFPNPVKLLSDLSAMGFHTVPIIDPGIKLDSTYSVYISGLNEDVYVKNQDGNNFIGPVWPGDCAFPDFTNPKTRSWWGKQFESLVKMGMTGFWVDMNEPSVFGGPGGTMPLNVMHNYEGQIKDHRAAHNVYGMQMARATFEAVRNLKPDSRPFVLSRANYAGGQRFTAVWTGDNVSSWEHLYQGIPTMLNLSISGQPFVGEDVGGFIGSPDGELFTRWLQKGVFHPFCRVHSEINSKPQEPWSYGEQYEAINKRYIELRYEFLPYFYTQFWNASKTGIPIMRPMIYNYPELEKFVRAENQFLIGDDILVCPVLQQGTNKLDVNIPPGIWYSFWTDKIMKEGEWQTVSAPIDTMPIFIRGGAILPMQNVVQNTSEGINQLYLNVYPDEQGKAFGENYEDTDDGYEYLNGVYRHTVFSYEQSDNQKVFSYSIKEGTWQPPKRTVTAIVHAFHWEPNTINLMFKLLEKIDSYNLFMRLESGWYYDAKKKILYVKWIDEEGVKLIIN
ncbi:MAG: glycoside hydrolase family 31 protein [Bacteroidota bacterium]|nr:glycoside hydrolase family 31 protein [Bacteroidota bacterium]